MFKGLLIVGFIISAISAPHIAIECSTYIKVVYFTNLFINIIGIVVLNYIDDYRIEKLEERVKELENKK